MATEDYGETTPLLSSSLEPEAEAEAGTHGAKINRKFVIAWITFLILLFDFALFLSTPAQNVIFEDIICKQHLTALNGTGSPIDMLPGTNPCKSEPVQSELSLVLGLKDTFEVLPCVLFGIPFGMLADSWGRRPVFFISFIGIVLVELSSRVICYWPETFPLRTVWYASGFYVFGGGGTVTLAMMFTIATDVTEPARRAGVYLMMMAGVLIADVFAAPLSAALIELTGPWVPYMITPLVAGFGSSLIWVLPETLHCRKRPEKNKIDDAEKESYLERLRSLNLSELGHKTRRNSRSLARALRQNLTLVYLVLVYFVAVLGRQTTQFIVLYASKKFHWSLARASYLYSLRSATNLVLLLLILPAISRLLMNRFAYSTARKDLFLLRLQTVVTILGFILIAVSEAPIALFGGVIVFALGAGFAVNARSLATALVQPEHFAAVNTALAVSQSVGGMAAGPLLAATYHRGLVLGGPWLGLPFWVAAGLFAVAAGVTGLIRIREVAAEDEDEAVREE